MLTCPRKLVQMLVVVWVWKPHRETSEPSQTPPVGHPYHYGTGGLRTTDLPCNYAEPCHAEIRPASKSYEQRLVECIVEPATQYGALATGSTTVSTMDSTNSPGQAPHQWHRVVLVIYQTPAGEVPGNYTGDVSHAPQGMRVSL